MKNLKAKEPKEKEKEVKENVKHAVAEEDAVKYSKIFYERN